MNKALELETVIGLEVHVQLKTKSKMFCRCDNRDDQAPNTAICQVCTGQPGALPVPNQQAIDWAVMTALALGCEINQRSKFDRKSYFYPDLPKGYQISQYDLPFGFNGKVTVDVNGELKAFRINRLHLEEDAGKLMHPDGQDYTLVDLNRTGTPLMEIVSEPDFKSPVEARAYLEQLRLMMRYLGVSDADMEKGHLRCDANISLRPQGDDKLYPKTEIKNMNSFRAVERGLAYEIERQTALWEDGHPPLVQSTRGWDESSGTTHEQRTKEEAADYRYFPEPDIPPVIISDEHLQELREAIPELPHDRELRYVEQYGLNRDLAEGLIGDKELADYFEEVASEFHSYAQSELGPERAGLLMDESGAEIYRMIANWLVNKITTEHRLQHGLVIQPADMARLMWLLRQGVINAPATNKIYETMVASGGKTGPHDLVKELGLEQMSDESELKKIVTEVITANEKVATEVRQGKAAAMQFLVGQVMKQTKGKANPPAVQEILKNILG
jgi:aspartyl-tRNA(Asn)/glutamyl-tRNA(Gln) amidotransferase subunit B